MQSSSWRTNVPSTEEVRKEMRAECLADIGLVQSLYPIAFICKCARLPSFLKRLGVADTICSNSILPLEAAMRLQCIQSDPSTYEMINISEC